MNKNIKIIAVSMLLIAITIVFYIYYIEYRENAKRGQLNRQRIANVEVGMCINEVNKIMNKPDTIYIINNDKSYHYKKRVFSYYRGPGIYGYLQIITDPSADTVIQVVNIIE